jgi:glycosyltransferase involved in cell wall biosynthesis
MRVLIVTQYFWPENFRINDLAQVLVERGHDVTVLTGVPNYPAGRAFSGYEWFRTRREQHAGIHIFRVPVIVRGSASALRLFLNYLSFAMSASVLGPILLRREFDAVLAFEPSPVTVGIPAIVMKKWVRAPLLFWVQDLWPESLSATGMVRSPLVISLVRALTGAIYRRCDRIMVQSEAFISRIQDVHGNRRPAQIDYLPNWAESFYQPVIVEPDAPEGIELPSGFRVLFAGNIGAAQSFETIIEAAQRLQGHPEIQWIVIGDGRRRAWLEQRRTELGLQDSLHLLGSREPHLMPRYFSLAHALLVTLRSDPIFDLTVPSKVQSYLACGRPIVAALNGEGQRIIRESGAGVAVPAGDSVALAAAVLKMSESSAAERDRMARCARQYYERHFEREAVIGRIERLMAEEVGGRR